MEVAILRRPAPTEARHLTGPEARIVEALSSTIFPEDGAIPAGARTARVVQWMDEYLGMLPPDKRLLLRAMFLLFEIDFAVFNPGPSWRFSSATPEERTRCLEGWDQSWLYPRRAAFQALKGTILLAYLRHPEVHVQMGIKRGEAALRDLAETAEGAD